MIDTYDLDHLSDHADSYGETAQDVTAEPVDIDQDGTVDGVAYEQSTGETIVLVDTDKDAAADLLGIDLEGDHQIDIYIARDGDSYVVWADDNQDGEVDRGEETTLSREELDELIPGAPDLLDQQIDDVVPTDDSDDSDDSDGDARPTAGSDGDVTGGIE
jgi:hypothetical protein